MSVVRQHRAYVGSFREGTHLGFQFPKGADMVDALLLIKRRNRLGPHRFAARGVNMAEDYRASASLDLKIDEADIKAGKKIQGPLLTLWAATGAMGKIYDVLETWKPEGVDVRGKGIGGTHQLQESAPKEVLAELLPFLRG
jgi:hypothetical protein